MRKGIARHRHLHLFIFNFFIVKLTNLTLRLFARLTSSKNCLLQNKKTKIYNISTLTFSSIVFNYIIHLVIAYLITSWYYDLSSSILHTKWLKNKNNYTVAKSMFLSLTHAVFRNKHIKRSDHIFIACQKKTNNATFQIV